MSYCRFGEDSDAYIWSDTQKLWVMISGNLAIDLPDKPLGANVMQHHRAGACFEFRDRRECYEHLWALTTEGVKIPGYVFERLYDEMQTQGDEIGRNP